MNSEGSVYTWFHMILSEKEEKRLNNHDNNLDMGYLHWCSSVTL